MSKGVFQTLDTLSSSDRYNTWIYNSFKEHLNGTVLDIGSGLGDIVKQYSGNNIDKVILSDYSEEMIDNLNKNFSDKENFSTVQMDIQGDDFYNTLAASSIDTITCINVLEHLKYDLASLINMHRLLKKDGKLIILVPAFQWLYGSLDTLVDHHRRYSKRSLRSVLHQSRFKVDEFKFMNFFGIITWFISGKVLKHKEFDKDACKKLDKLVPYLEKFESTFKPLIGQSLIAICSKT